MRDELQTVLDAVQVEITRSYTDALTDGDKNGRLRDYIEKCVLDGGYSVWGFTTRQLIDRLYDEMARYSTEVSAMSCRDVGNDLVAGSE